jgi:SAM-dependent methyltransferase
MSSRNRYDPGAYWDKRLAADFDLRGAGYRSLGARYNTRLYQARLDALRRGLAHLNLSPPSMCAAEIGCGSGFYTEYFSRIGVARYTGIDISRTAVARLKELYPRYRFIEHDVTQPLKESIGPFDLVLAADVLFHIVDDEAFGRAIANLLSWVKEGGALVVSDVFPPITSQVADHVRFRQLEMYRRYLPESGWEVAEILPIFGLLHPIQPVRSAGSVWWAVGKVWTLASRAVGYWPADAVVSSILGLLDDIGLRELVGRDAPVPKWLFARRPHAP